MWRGREPEAIAGSLLDALVRILDLDFAYARLNEKITGRPGEMVRVGRRAAQPASAEDLGRLLLSRLERDSHRSATRMSHPLGEGMVTAAYFPLGIHDEIGLIVAGCTRPGFPTAMEDLIVQVAANQAVVGLQEARRLGAEVSHRQRTEEERVKLASLVENSDDFIGIATLEGKVLFVNPAGKAMAGYDGHGQPQTVTEFVIEEERPRIANEVLPAVLETGRWDGEMRFRNFATGAATHMHTSVFVIRDPEGGAPVAIATISRDITQRKQAEVDAQRLREKLAQSETYLAEGQRLSHTASWAYKVGTGEIIWSLEHFRIWGLDPRLPLPCQDELLAQLHPEDVARVRADFEQAVRDEAEFSSQFRIVRGDGALRYIESIGHPVRGERGRMIEYVGTVIDLTDRKLAEDDLGKARRDLAHVARVTTMGELTASIAHEVNQPLAAVVTNANACLHWLAAATPNMAESQAAARRIIRDANRASDVIRGIRAFLMRGTPEKTVLDLDDLIRDVVLLVEGEARGKGVTLTVPAAVRAPRVRGDRVQLQQVILNLLVNAIDAVSLVTDRARAVELGAHAHEGGEACIYVRDNGPGLDERTRDRVFDPFYTTKQHGMGLGLAISRTIVETHGGRLWSASNQDSPGETFRFTLPSEGS
jgi:PAS domain S-box-containing protein